MAKLILKEFRCVNQAFDMDDMEGVIKGNSPYFITFVGDITKSVDNATIKLSRRGEWHNEVNHGELFVPNETITGDFSLNPAHTVVLVALIEEDGNVDVTLNELENIRNTLSLKLLDFKASGSIKVTQGIFQALKAIFDTKVRNSLASSGAADDLLGIRPKNAEHPWLNGQTSSQPLMHFVGLGGHYRVRYTISS